MCEYILVSQTQPKARDDTQSRFKWQLWLEDISSCHQNEKRSHSLKTTKAQVKKKEQPWVVSLSGWAALSAALQGFSWCCWGSGRWLPSGLPAQFGGSSSPSPSGPSGSSDPQSQQSELSPGQHDIPPACNKFPLLVLWHNQYHILVHTVLIYLGLWIVANVCPFHKHCKKDVVISKNDTHFNITCSNRR